MSHDDLSHIVQLYLTFIVFLLKYLLRGEPPGKLFVNPEQKFMSNICSNFSVIGRIELNNYLSSSSALLYAESISA